MKPKLIASALLLLTAIPLQADEPKAAALVKRFGGSMNREENLDPKSPIVLIFLGKNAVQDGDLKDLADLKELRALDLTNAKITDEGMKHLKASTKLEWFTAYNTGLSDGTMKLFAECKGMKKLHIANTRVTDAGVKELLKLVQLEVLDLTGTDITEKCLDDLVKIKSLRHLRVGSQHFTDAGIQKLAALTDLRSLGISNSIHVTSDGIAKLRKAMPNCKVNEPVEPPKAPALKDGPLGMKFVPIRKGTFYMCWDGQKGSTKKTEIKEDFEIAVYTVTQGQWQKLMGKNPSCFSRESEGEGKDK